MVHGTHTNAQLTESSSVTIPLTTTPLNNPAKEQDQQQNHSNGSSQFLVALPSSSSYPKSTSLSPMSKMSIFNVDPSPLQPPPVANGGPDQIVIAGSTVSLNGSESKSLNGIILAYSWMQFPTGSGISLGRVNTPVWQFVAPKVSTDTLIRFQLNVTDNVGQTSTAFVNILDKPHNLYTTSALAQNTTPQIVTTPVPPENNQFISSYSIKGSAKDTSTLPPPLIPAITKPS